MSFGKFLAEQLGEMAEVVETVKVRVGRVSKELQDEFDANNEAHEAEHNAIKKKIHEFIEQVQKEHSCDKFNDIEADLWERMYDELGLTELERGLRYSISHNRAVFRLDDAEQDIEKDKEISLQ